jgi:hypothetical protein
MPSSGVRIKDPVQLGLFEGAGLGHWAQTSSPPGNASDT